MMGRSVQLPELADLGALPAPDRGAWTFGRGGMCAAMLDGPAADLGAVELEGEQSQGFRGGEAVRARRGAGQAFLEEVGDRFGPGGGVVTTGDSRNPLLLALSGARTNIGSEEHVEAAAGDVELLGGFSGRQGVLSEGGQDVPNESRRVAVG